MNTSDLTIILITANKVPTYFAQVQKEYLLEAAKGSPIIIISYKPMDWGNLNLLQTEYSVDNVYRQILRGAKEADTPYIALAEDDTLYGPNHFHQFRPDSRKVAYDQTCWQLQTWSPTYYLRYGSTNCTLLAARQLVINAIEERYAKWPDGLPPRGAGELGRYMVEVRRLKVSLVPSVSFRSIHGVVQFQHPYSVDHLEQKQRKKMGAIRAYELPFWGRGEDLVKLFREEE